VVEQSGMTTVTDDTELRVHGVAYRRSPTSCSCIQFTTKTLSFGSLISNPTIFTTSGPRFTPASRFPAL
jgi:hypothetical protein